MLPGAGQFCETQTATATHLGNEVLEPDDVLQFALHTLPGNTLGTVLALNSEPAFDFQPGTMSFGTTYYLSAIAGNDDGNGNVDLGDPCLSVAPGASVEFHQLTTATLSGDAEICEGGMAGLTVHFTGEAPWLLDFTINGITSQVLIFDNPYVFNFSTSTTLCLTGVLGSFSCGPGTATGCATVSVTPTLNITNLTESCSPDNTEYTVFFTITGGDPATYSVTPPNGTLSGSNFTSNPIPSGSAYDFLVSDASGCGTAVANLVVTCDCPPPGGTADVTIIPPLCAGGLATVTVSATGGTPPYLYFWGFASGEFTTTDSVVQLMAGTYLLTVWDVNFCVVAGQQVVVDHPQIPQILCAFDGPLSIGCGTSIELGLDCIGGTPPYSVAWSNGQAEPVATITNPGVYAVTVTDANGCSSFVVFLIEQSSENCGRISGRLAKDELDNCQDDGIEPGLAGWMVKATGTGSYYGYSGPDGSYEILAEPGSYILQAIPPVPGLWQPCLPLPTAFLANVNDVDTVDILLSALVECPLLEVDISTPFLRRCFDNTFHVNYCNLGSADAENAYIEVTLDPFIAVTGSQIPYTGPVNGVYTFHIGDVPLGECGHFTILTHLSCDAQLGQTLCVEAHIYPDSLCTPVQPAWSGAFIEITSECTADSVIFTITNTGTGDMTTPVGFVVVEDGVMLMQGPDDQVLLVAGASTMLSFPANGSTYTLIVGQVEHAPGFSAPLLSIEGCGTNNMGTFSTGFVNQFPENDADPFVSIECRVVVGAYDPNDKNAFPIGFGDEHLIERGQVLDYHIRFQNTGTDTAFTVIIHDVIAPALDLSTLRPGPASHPYFLEIRQDTLVFIFENILLPDSNVNEPGSHGFVKFRIGQQPDLPLGSVIENDAAIYFDFNDPILTNTTFHKIGQPFTLVPAGEYAVKKFHCRVFPNPIGETATFIVEGGERENFDLLLYDLTGRMVRSQKVTGGIAQIQQAGLPSGFYFYEIRLNGLSVGQGKLAVGH